MPPSTFATETDEYFCEHGRSEPALSDQNTLLIRARRASRAAKPFRHGPAPTFRDKKPPWSSKAGKEIVTLETRAVPSHY